MPLSVQTRKTVAAEAAKKKRVGPIAAPTSAPVRRTVTPKVAFPLPGFAAGAVVASPRVPSVVPTRMPVVAALPSRPKFTQLPVADEGDSESLGDLEGKSPPVAEAGAKTSEGTSQAKDVAGTSDAAAVAIATPPPSQELVVAPSSSVGATAAAAKPPSPRVKLQVDATGTRSGSFDEALQLAAGAHKTEVQAVEAQLREVREEIQRLQLLCRKNDQAPGLEVPPAGFITMVEHGPRMQELEEAHKVALKEATEANTVVLREFQKEIQDLKELNEGQKKSLTELTESHGKEMEEKDEALQ